MLVQQSETQGWGELHIDFVVVQCMIVIVHVYTCIIIAERNSSRHWIVDYGPGMGSCMYVCPSPFWNAIKVPRMRNDNSIYIIFVCVSAYMHCSLHTHVPGS